MAIAREQLIAEWRERLAAAENAPAEGAARPAWLVRVRLRMYRFLLSLYGEGACNVGQPRAAGATDEALNSQANVDLALVHLAGKPAKNNAEIRGVLAGLAEAQSPAIAPGPLIAGLPAESWVLVGVCRGNEFAGDWVELLKQKGLTPCIRCYGQGESIEVPAGQRQEAFAVMSALAQQRVRARRAKLPVRRSSWPPFVAVMGMFSSLFIMISAFLIGSAIVDWHGTYPSDPISRGLAKAQLEAVWEGLLSSEEWPRFLLLSLALLGQTCLLVWLRRRHLARLARNIMEGARTDS